MAKNFTKQIAHTFKVLALSGLIGLSSFGVFAQTNDNGSVESFRQVLSNHFNTKNQRKQANPASENISISFQVASQAFQAKVNASYNNAGYETYAGRILNHGWAEFHVQFKNGKASGLVILFDEKKAYEFITNASGM